jgi:hypothetical protein
VPGPMLASVVVEELLELCEQVASWYKSTCFTGTKVQILTSKRWTQPSVKRACAAIAGDGSRVSGVSICTFVLSLLALLVQPYQY